MNRICPAIFFLLVLAGPAAVAAQDSNAQPISGALNRLGSANGSLPSSTANAQGGPEWVNTGVPVYEPAALQPAAYTTSADADPDTRVPPPDELGEIKSNLVQMQAGMQNLQTGVEELGRNLRVTTVNKDWGIGIFGSLNGELLFSEQRPFLPSGVVLLFPDLGKDTPTFEAHAKSTNIGAAVSGPEILGLQSGGMFLTYLYGEQFEADNYGLFIVRAYGDLKDQRQRIAIGIEGDVINPLAPTTLNYNAGNLAGNLGFFRGQFRYERYLHFSEASQLTTQCALSNPVSTSFANLSIPPNYLLEDNSWPNLEGRMAIGLGEKSGPPGQAVRPVEFGGFRFSGPTAAHRHPDHPQSHPRWVGDRR